MGGLLSMWLQVLAYTYCDLLLAMLALFSLSWGQRLRTEAFAAALDIITKKMVHCHPCNKYSSDA